MKTAYLLLDIARKLAAPWFCSCLRITFPFLFSFCFGDGEGHGLLLGSFVFLLLEIARKLAAPWFFSCLCITFPFLFSFCFCDDEGHDLLLGFFFFLVCRGRLKTRILILVFWVYCLYWSLFYGFLSSVYPSFSFVPNLSISLFCLLPPCLEVAFVQPL